MSRSLKLAFLFAVALGAALFVFVHAPIPQPPGYHSFADQRTLLGIPNFWNVVSNLPFLLVAVAGLSVLFSGRSPGALPELRAAYGTVFVGTLFVAFGSACYHLFPCNATLVWDRLPMTVAFMGFFAVIVGEHISIRVATALLGPLVVAGVASVVYWRLTDVAGQGDLRPYVLVQYLPLLLIPFIVVLFPSALLPTRYIWALLLAYAVAKALELLDLPIYRVSRVISGHTLKHIVAGAGLYFLVLAIKRRKPRTALRS